MNSKLYINENQLIRLPKNWLFSLSSTKHSKVILIDEKFILDNKIDIHNVSLHFEKENNKGLVEFPNTYWKNILLEKRNYTLHDGIYCRYRVYTIDSKVDRIFIPKKNAILSFGKYDETISTFINEFCRE